MGENLLKNGGFEADWGDEKSHECFVFKPGGTVEVKNVGNIFTPPGWATWFWHYPFKADNNCGYDQPEVTDTAGINDPNRTRTGQRAMRLFTFERRHDGGFLQQVDVEPGQMLRLSAYAHGWSSHPLAGYDWCHRDGRCSMGVGVGGVVIAEGDAPPISGDPWNDAIGNFTFYVGIDPTGGVNPFADTVVWGNGAHIYNTFAPVPPVEVQAGYTSAVTVFLRSKTRWAFKHNDAYWDDVTLEVVDVEPPLPPDEVTLTIAPEQPRVGEVVTATATSQTELTGVGFVLAFNGIDYPFGVGESWHADGEHWWKMQFWARSPGLHSVAVVSDTCDDVLSFEALPRRGSPRVQYSRTYVLLPPDAGADWARAVVEGSWDKARFTIGGSADDAGIGNLDERRVIAVNPHHWPDDLQAFFVEYYPGVEYVAVTAATPEELAGKLEGLA